MEDNCIPMVSIGMPVYNGEKFIRKAIDSLLSQTFTEFELIISDNHSTDQTGEICRAYTQYDRRIRYIRQPKNMGAAWNFDFALHESIGKYFMWAACDDEWSENFIEQCISVLDKERADLGCVMTRYIVRSRNFKAIATMRNFPNFSFLWKENKDERVKKFVLLAENTHKANFLYGVWRKEILKQISFKFKGLERFTGSGIDMARLAYGLSISRYKQINKGLFVKYYKNFPPGSLIGNIYNNILSIFRQNRSCTINNKNKSLAKNIYILTYALKQAGFSEQYLNDILLQKYAIKENSSI